MTATKKIADDIFMAPWDQGNGQLRREVWVDGEGKVTRYDLAYINPGTFAGEEGKVLGYDFLDGRFHCHLKGSTTEITLESFEELEDIFNIKWDNMPREGIPQLSSSGEAGSGEIDLNKIGEMDDYAETKGMKLTITKGHSTDFFHRGKELARKLDHGESVEPGKVVIFGHRDDLCYTGLQKR
ncbi:MAG TPA: hypothetical protein VMJ66_08465 [Geobacteraceae bacterium]|nr:hypothetical protein [Geobacteraceae bacterium]